MAMDLEAMEVALRGALQRIAELERRDRNAHLRLAKQAGRPLGAGGSGSGSGGVCLGTLDGKAPADITGYVEGVRQGLTTTTAGCWTLTELGPCNE